MILTKTYKEPAICKKEILRYAGCNDSDNETLEILDDCLNEIRSKLTYKICYCELPLKINGDSCDFDAFTLQSKNLVKNLNGCHRVIVFAATIGVAIDRLIAKYGRISPVKALLFQAIGAERIEALCDAFNEDMGKNLYLKSRFSPGYGDLSLDAQKDIFRVLQCSKQIGLCLNDSLLMSPSKSVTAIIGISQQPIIRERYIHKCSACDKKDCIFRSEI